MSSDYMASMLAAKYKAERDQARQEVERMRPAYEWVSKNGGLDITEAQCKFSDDAASWIRKLCKYEDDEVVNIDAAMYAIERRLMPKGMEWLLEVWPKWSNGDYCKFGDWWKADKYGEHEPQQFFKLSIYTPEQLKKWEQDDGDNFGYEWDFMRPSDPKYRPDKVDCPYPIGADGLPIREGETAYRVDDGKEVKVLTVLPSGSVNTVVRGIGIGKEVWIDSHRLTHTKPEHPDSWERLEHDAEGIERDCGGTWHKPDGSSVNVVDIVRRAKALAEKKED